MRSVLITGGTGFLGHGLVLELLKRGVERICIYSRDEMKQAVMRAEIPDPGDRMRWLLGDVRDLQRLTRAMAGVDTVIHTAALKRIQTGTYNPDEMVKTNVGGAMNVIQASIDARVDKVVAVSSDKAYQGISPYGQSKALAEALFLNANNARGAAGPIYSVARYGNVWNSRGSVVPTWKAAMARGQPLRVTDPDCTRFFMLREEAVALVLDTVEIMIGGDLVIPKLPAYRLGDLVTAITMDNPYATIEICGLPKFEKLHETMCEGACSADALRMTVEQLHQALERS